MAAPGFRFGPFAVDPRTRELRKGGVKIRLQGQSAEMLLMLLEHPGELVTRDELRQKLWPEGTFVDFDHGLNVAVNRLRSRLGETAEKPRFIETLPGQGYRFIAPVDVVEPEPPAVTPPPAESQPEPPTRRRRSLVLAAILVVLLAAAGVYTIEQRGARARIESLAVIPLQSLSADPDQEYFVDGLTDTLITELSKISSLRVISRTSSMQYRNTKKKLPEIARELNVDGVIEGTVMRSGGRVRTTVQLLNGRLDKHLWADAYEGDLSDILKLQSHVAQAVAVQVRAQLTSPQQARLSSVRVVNPEAYDAYLRGRYFWNQRTEGGLWKSIELFQHATNIDPGWALPYTGVADAYDVLDSWTVEAIAPGEGVPKSRAAVEKALQLDPELAEVHTVAAAFKHGNWDWSGAEAEYRRAIELNPSYAHAHQWYSQLLAERGRFDEAVSEAGRAHALDPLSLILGADMGNRLYWARRYKDAIPPLQKTLELDSNFRVAHRFLGQVYEQLGMYEAATEELRRAAQLSSGNPIDLGALGHALAASGHHAEAIRLSGELKALSAKRYVSAYQFALVDLGLGAREEAMQALERAFEEHSMWLLHLKVDPRLDPLRGDPRFQDLLRRVGF